MRCLFSQLTRRRSGAHARKDTVLVADILRLGRHASSEIYLADARVLLSHACIYQRPDGFYIEAQGGADLRVNSISLASARLKPGDRIDLGPYELVVAASAAEYDLALSCELSRPPANDLDALQARSVVSLRAAGLSRRSTSWLAFGLVLAGLLLLPWVAFYSAPVARFLDEQGVRPDLAWSSGPMSTAHGLFGHDCKACHLESFARVSDGTCGRCHQRTLNHADAGVYAKAGLVQPDCVACHLESFARVSDGTCGRCHQRTLNHADAGVYARAGLVPPGCVACHREHNGRNGLVREQEPACAACHADLNERLPGRNLRNASDFGWHHPEFRKPVPMPASNLKFPHARHLHPDSSVSLDDQCRTCHIPEQQGAGMQPVVMTRHCQQCHGLTADPEHPEQVLPHAAPEVVLSVLIEQWQGNHSRPAGQKAPRTPEVTDDGWVKLAESVFEGPVCARCHEVQRDDARRQPAWLMAPVQRTAKWWPGTRFSHHQHQAAACSACHNTAIGSILSADSLLPQLADCRTCHRGDKPADGRLETFCVDCHVYHGASDARAQGPP